MYNNGRVKSTASLARSQLWLQNWHPQRGESTNSKACRDRSRDPVSQPFAALPVIRADLEVKLQITLSPSTAKTLDEVVLPPCTRVHLQQLQEQTLQIAVPLRHAHLIIDGLTFVLPQLLLLLLLPPPPPPAPRRCCYCRNVSCVSLACLIMDALTFVWATTDMPMRNFFSVMSNTVSGCRSHLRRCRSRLWLRCLWPWCWRHRHCCNWRRAFAAAAAAAATGAKLVTPASADRNAAIGRTNASADRNAVDGRTIAGQAGGLVTAEGFDGLVTVDGLVTSVAVAVAVADRLVSAAMDRLSFFRGSADRNAVIGRTNGGADRNAVNGGANLGADGDVIMIGGQADGVVIALTGPRAIKVPAQSGCKTPCFDATADASVAGPKVALQQSAAAEASAALMTANCDEPRRLALHRLLPRAP